MLFNSLSFLIFFPVVTLAFFIAKPQHRWLLLLIASCVFYMSWIPIYITVLLAIILIDYFAARIMEPLEGSSRKLALIASILANCGVLCFFKYYDFLDTNLSALCQTAGINYVHRKLEIILPIGLSFHTFQALSYTIEVYRRRQAAEHHLGIYALYVLFYPQLVAGPVERPQNLLHQFRERRLVTYDEITSGLRLMLWGFFKKIVIADRLAPLVDQVFNQPELFSGPPLMLAAGMFLYQIFCDFSGYSDIAVGAARVMGFRLMINFRRPFFATSIDEFWRRWHISLSTWFRDYVYIPLGGSRVSQTRHYANILLVFMISGLWHGAEWTFVIWGLLHGVLIVLFLASKSLRASVNLTATLPGRVLSMLVTFATVCFSMIFFRARSLQDAFYILQNMFAAPHYGSPTEVPFLDSCIVVIAIAIMETVHLLEEFAPKGNNFRHWPEWLRWTCYYLAIAAIILLSAGDSRQFIYFQF